MISSNNNAHRPLMAHRQAKKSAPGGRQDATDVLIVLSFSIMLCCYYIYFIFMCPCSMYTVFRLFIFYVLAYICLQQVINTAICTQA